MIEEIPTEKQVNLNDPLKAQQEKVEELKKKFALLRRQHSAESHTAAENVAEARKNSEMATAERIKVTQTADQKASPFYRSNTALKQIDKEKFSIFDSSQDVSPTTTCPIQQEEKTELNNRSLVF